MINSTIAQKVESRIIPQASRSLSNASSEKRVVLSFRQTNSFQTYKQNVVTGLTKKVIQFARIQFAAGLIMLEMVQFVAGLVIKRMLWIIGKIIGQTINFAT